MPTNSAQAILAEIRRLTRKVRHLQAAQAAPNSLAAMATTVAAVLAARDRRRVHRPQHDLLADLQRGLQELTRLEASTTAPRTTSQQRQASRSLAAVEDEDIAATVDHQLEAQGVPANEQNNTRRMATKLAALHRQHQPTVLGEIQAQIGVQTREQALDRELNIAGVYCDERTVAERLAFKIKALGTARR